jgi:hypothetical protein
MPVAGAESAALRGVIQVEINAATNIAAQVEFWDLAVNAATNIAT